MTKKQKKNLIRIIVSAALMTLFIFLPTQGILRFALFMIPYLIIGYDILIKAGKGIINLKPFDECFLMALATVGALIVAVVGDGDYVEAIAVMLFYQLGEWFQSYAVGKSRKNISDLMDICPEYANIETDGELVQVDPDEVGVGTVITVKPGERIPIDGVVVSGHSFIDTSALTGESVPRETSEGDSVVSGCVNGSGLIRLRTTKAFEDSTVSRILELVENASSRRSTSESFITRFARVYTPVVVFSALALALLPPLISMFFLGADPSWRIWIYRALTFLVISCPCALVISVPLSFFAGIGGAGNAGILIKGSNYLELLSKASTVVFDKTGTLTKGVFEVTEVSPSGVTEDELLTLAASAEQYSAHPIAVSLLDACKVRELPKAENVSEIAGAGVKAEINCMTVCAGNARIMEGAAGFSEVKKPGTVVYISRDGIYLGYIVISDTLKENSAAAISALHRSGIKRTVMLTGDNEAAAKAAAEKLGIDEVCSGLLPEDKVRITAGLIEKRGKNEAVVFVGDGINDAPVLAEADIGVAMGAMGSDAAIEASDIVLMNDDPLKISKAIAISRKCMRIVKENIWFSIGIKVLCLVLGALGIANMWVAVFADVGVMVIAVLNAMRNLIVRKK